MRVFFTVFLVVSAFAAMVFGWGFTIHRMIARVAVDRLPETSSNYFGPLENEIVLYSTYPDEHRTEPNAHFMEIDYYGRYPFAALPHDFDKAVEKYGESIVKAHGWAPWAVKKYYDKLVEAIATNSPDVAKYAGMMAHFASDLHMPLHATENFDGQYTGQSGIHGLWESVIVNNRFEASMIGPTSVSTISDIVGQCFGDVLVAWKDSTVLLADAKKAADNSRLWETTESIAASEITRSVWMVSSLLNEAYADSKSYVPPEKEKPSVTIFKISPKGDDEFVAIKNTGKEPVNLSGWKISSGKSTYVFGDIELQPNRYLILHSGPKARGLVWTTDCVWPDSSGKAVLNSPDGDLESALSY